MNYYSIPKTNITCILLEILQHTKKQILLVSNSIKCVNTNYNFVLINLLLFNHYEPSMLSACVLI